jgi:high affinity sulfate transporter 1
MSSAPRTADARDRGPTLLPPRRWLAAYRSEWLSADLLAGVTLAAYAIPVALAYAGLAGLPPQVGVYGYLLGGLGYALLGSSRHLAVGPTSAISLMVGGTIAQMVDGDVVRWAQIATLAGFVVAILCVIGWVLRLSTLTSFISETNLLGFKAGAGLSIASTQLAAFFGVPGGGDHFFSRLSAVGSQLGDLHVLTTAIGIAAVFALIAGERLYPGRPIALFVVVTSILLVSLGGLGEAGVALVGAVPSGLPSLGLPELRARDVDGVLPLAFACVLLAYIEGVSAARAFAAKHDYPIDVRQELLALGGANLLAAFGGGYPVAGGLSQTAVNEKAGAKTPLALVFASGTLALCLLFLTGFVQSLPRVVLAAIVLVAVKGLFDFKEVARLRRISRLDFNVAMIAFAGVLLLGILKGVLLAAIASILLLLRRAAYPHIALLGRVPGTSRFSDLERHPENERLEGVLVVRVEASMLYFNVESILATILEHVNAASDLRLVVLDLSTSPYVDVAGATMVSRLEAELRKRRITLRLAEIHATTRDLLRAEGLDARVSGIDRRTAVSDAVERFQRESAPQRA